MLHHQHSMISLGISRHEGASFISWMLLQTLNKTSLNYRFKSASAGRNADANGRLCIRRRGLLTKRLPLTSWGVVERQLDFLRRPRDPGLKRPPPPPPPTFLLAPTLSARPSSVSAHLPELSALLLPPPTPGGCFVPAALVLYVPLASPCYSSVCRLLHHLTETSHSGRQSGRRRGEGGGDEVGPTEARVDKRKAERSRTQEV